MKFRFVVDLFLAAVAAWLFIFNFGKHLFLLLKNGGEGNQAEYMLVQGVPKMPFGKVKFSLKKPMIEIGEMKCQRTLHKSKWNGGCKIYCVIRPRHSGFSPACGTQRGHLQVKRNCSLKWARRSSTGRVYSKPTYSNVKKIRLFPNNDNNDTQTHSHTNSLSHTHTYP